MIECMDLYYYYYAVHTHCISLTPTHTQLAYMSGALEWPLLGVYSEVSVEFGLRRELHFTLRTSVSIATQ